MLLMNIIVLAMEVLYYSLFMKFAKGEGKLWRYLLSFSLVSTILLFIGTNHIYSYLLSMIIMLYGIKYIGRIKIKIYDLLFIFLMLVFKIFVETITIIPIYYIILNMFVATLITGFLKISVIILLRNKINTFYKVVENKWHNNNFYIRYIFDILMFIYVIVSCLFLIFNK